MLHYSRTVEWMSLKENSIKDCHRKCVPQRSREYIPALDHHINLFWANVMLFTSNQHKGDWSQDWITVTQVSLATVSSGRNYIKFWWKKLLSIMEIIWLNLKLIPIYISGGYLQKYRQTYHDWSSNYKLGWFLEWVCFIRGHAELQDFG